MPEKINKWLSCPQCGFNSFEKDDIVWGEKIECPECESKTYRRFGLKNNNRRKNIPTPEEIAASTGADIENIMRMRDAFSDDE